MHETEVYWKNAFKVTGTVLQKGILVLRPHYASFAPTEGAVNVLGAAAAGVAGAFAGYAVRVVPAQFGHVGEYIGHIAEGGVEDFDGHMSHAARAGGWPWIAPDRTRVLRKKVLFRGSRLFLWFEQDKDSYRFNGPIEKEREQAVRQLLGQWKVTW